MVIQAQQYVYFVFLFVAYFAMNHYYVKYKSIHVCNSKAKLKFYEGNKEILMLNGALCSDILKLSSRLFAIFFINFVSAPPQCLTFLSVPERFEG